MYMIVDNTELYECYLTAIERNYRDHLIIAGSDEITDAKIFNTYTDAFNYFIPLVKEKHDGRHRWTITPVHSATIEKGGRSDG